MFFSGVGGLHRNNRSVLVAPRPWVKHEATIHKKSLLPASDWLPLSPTCCSLLLKADCKSTLKETESPSASSSLQSECEIKCHIRQTGGGICNSWVQSANKNSSLSPAQNRRTTFTLRSQWWRTSQGWRKMARPLTPLWKGLELMNSPALRSWRGAQVYGTDGCAERHPVSFRTRT